MGTLRIEDLTLHVSKGTGSYGVTSTASFRVVNRGPPAYVQGVLFFQYPDGREYRLTMPAFLLFRGRPKEFSFDADGVATSVTVRVCRTFLRFDCDEKVAYH